MPQSHSLPQRYDSCITGVTPLQQPNSSTNNSSSNRQMNEPKLVGTKRSFSSVEHSARSERKSTHYNAPLPNSDRNTASIPQCYKPDLTPQPSVLRPHCLARDHLRLWTPAGISTRQAVITAEWRANHEISDTQLECILDVIGSSWAQSTKETYGAGLLVFHVFCDTNNVPEDQHCPIV
jgi:hypothetical protein